VSSPFKAVIFDAYGTLLRDDDLVRIPRQIVADHGLTARIEDVWRAWSELYFEATQLGPFRTLREIEAHILPRVLRQFDVGADAAPYVELFFRVTTKVELYPETSEVLNALGPVRSAIVSNADHEHVAAWNFTLPVEFILISESVRAYKPHRLVFERALERLGLAPHEVLHVGDSDVDASRGEGGGLRVARVNRDGRARRRAGARLRDSRSASAAAASGTRSPGPLASGATRCDAGSIHLSGAIRYRKRDAMRLSARNVLKGKVIEVKKGATTAHVRIQLPGGAIITSSITNEAVEELRLATGDDAYAVIKASDVMVGRD
jgi:2-haloalkanoic acid dehalogenase type II